MIIVSALVQTLTVSSVTTQSYQNLSASYYGKLSSNQAIRSIGDMKLDPDRDEYQWKSKRNCLTEDQKKERALACVNNIPSPSKSEEASLLSWMEQCIVEYYCFTSKISESTFEWESQPTFEGLLEEGHFKVTAEFSKAFFIENNDWKATVNKFSGKMLLYITAARYIFVTYLLYQESRDQDDKGKYLDGTGKLKPCDVVFKKQNAEEQRKTFKYVIPDYSCFPVPYGSARSTSDYDVGLVGPKSGDLLANFNDKFEEMFWKSSEEVFDTNIYAYTLEYAIPSKFEGTTSCLYLHYHVRRVFRKNFRYTAKYLSVMPYEIFAIFKV